MRVTSALALRGLVLSAWLVADAAAAGLPRPVARAFLDQHIPLTAVSAYVQELGNVQPLFSQQPSKPMNPASTMKLLTTFAGLELLGPDYRWRTEVYAGGPITAGVLNGNLVLKGYGDPKITIEQFQELITRLRATGLSTIRGDLVLDRTFFAPAAHDPAAFDGEPLKPYNVGPDALLVSFKSVRFVFAPNPAGDAVDVHAEPALASVTIRGAPRLTPGDCGDWRASLQAVFATRPDRAEATFGGRYPAACGERDWYVAMLDHPHFVRESFARAWADAGGSFEGRVRDGTLPPGAKPLVTLESAPLYDIVRDINKLSNNVMARQLFLTLATTAYPPPATTAHATDAVKRWLRGHKLNFPELVLDNGSGLSRRERMAAQSLGRVLLAAYGSDVRADYVSSLAVAATDGTVRKRFENDAVAEQAFLKTGSLEGVRAIAGYVFAPNGRSFVVVCFVNHPNAARAQVPLDILVEWVYATAGGDRSR
jgi:D-alanyl-D-alanine carboxypeptidase/D-alanyl-D-alanine-endopeptidase (penicillin-binding protein 4)